MQFVDDASERRGTAMRNNRNMVAFLAPDSKRLEELMDAMRQFMGWQWMKGRYDEENLTPNSQRQVESNVDRFDQDVSRRISDTYYWTLVPSQPDPQSPSGTSVEKADGAHDGMALKVTDRLARAGMLVTQIHPRNIRMELETKLKNVWQQGHISVGDLWAYYCRYPYLTRLRDRAVLTDGIRSVLVSLAAETDGFALAESFNDIENKYVGLTAPSGAAQFGQILDTTLLVEIGVANAQLDENKTGDVTSHQPTDNPPDLGTPVDLPKESGELLKSRYFGVVELDPERNARDFGRISTEVLAQFLAIEGSQVEVTVEIRATTKDGFSDDKIRIVSENARTLKFKQSGFEQA
jgi:hypothetical protein